MNCDQFQQRLLGAADPEHPPADLGEHLTTCPACRAWQRQLVRIERHVPLLPVPASHGKGRFVQRVLNEPGLIRSPATLPLRQRPNWRKFTLGIAGAAAAAVLLVAGVLFFQSRNANTLARRPVENRKTRNQPALPSTELQSTLTLVARLVDCDERLAQADTPRQRVQSLADLAEALRDQAKTLGFANAPEALETVAGLYRRVIREGIVPQARTLPGGERSAILVPIAARLAQVEREVELVAQNAGPTTAERLRQVALVAREGDAELRRLAKGGTP